MHSIPEAIKQKTGLVDKYLVRFEKLGGGNFCFGVREITVDYRANEPIVRYLVLDTSIWSYLTARDPQALEALVEKLNQTTTTPLKEKDLYALARKVDRVMADRVPNRGNLTSDSYIFSRKAALLLALCRHITGCPDPDHCTWKQFLEQV